VIGSASVAFASEALPVLVVASAVPRHLISNTATKRVRGNRLSFILSDGMGMAIVRKKGEKGTFEAERSRG
jgi:hypothetical protein